MTKLALASGVAMNFPVAAELRANLSNVARVAGPCFRVLPTGRVIELEHHHDLDAHELWIAIVQQLRCLFECSLFMDAMKDLRFLLALDAKDMMSGYSGNKLFLMSVYGMLQQVLMEPAKSAKRLMIGMKVLERSMYAHHRHLQGIVDSGVLGLPAEM
jgi:hypothetical protein